MKKELVPVFFLFSFFAESMFPEIRTKLDELEKSHGVRVLYACESGSRAWGFASPDSDYDVRFIYAFPGEEYLSIDERRDTIDIPVNDVLDISGWELRKALRLFGRSNVSLYEWLQSPCVYKQSGPFTEELRALMPEYFSTGKGCYHYMGVVRTAWAELQGEEVRIKRYFYCLRSLLAACWIIERQEVPPMEFGKLRTLIKDEIWQKAIENLLALKTVSDEKTLVSPVPLLHSFIEERMEFCTRLMPGEGSEPDRANLNGLFRKLIS